MLEIPANKDQATVTFLCRAWAIPHAELVRCGAAVHRHEKNNIKMYFFIDLILLGTCTKFAAQGYSGFELCRF